MGTQVILLVFATASAFVMGYATNQGSTCAVAAARQLVLDRRVTKLAGFGAAAGAAGLVCLPLAWMAGAAAHLPGEAAVGLSLTFGAALLGIGAVVNDACLFGTLSRIGRGELRFLALPVGLGLGFAVATRQSLITTPSLTPSAFAKPSLPGFLVVLACGLILAGSLRILTSTGNGLRRPGRWPLGWAMVILGAIGALLFAITPEWTYADALRHGIAPGGASAMVGLGAPLAGAAAVCGTILSGMVTHSFRYQRPSLRTIGRSLAGGAIMAVGAMLIPGGNDSLLLAAIPAGTLRGLTAFAVMLVTVIGLTQLQVRRPTSITR